MVNEPGRGIPRQARLTLGERLVDLPLLDVTGVALSLYHPRVHGWRKVIHLARDAQTAQRELTRFAELTADFAELDIHVIAITCAAAEENAAWVKRLNIPYPVLSDSAGVLFRAAGLEGDSASCTLLFDPVLRLEAKIDAGPAVGQADAAFVRSQTAFAARKPIEVTEQAPALVIPNLLDPEHCKALMAYWEQGQKVDNVVASRAAQRNQANEESKVRSDVILEETSADFRALIGALQRRLFPEIQKAFNFEVTRTERFRIGCYEASKKGFFAPHRDNTSLLTAHRRFAITINLNTGAYEGGHLKIPEYGPHLYGPPAGGAIVFSCGLLHAASPVTEGRRFVVVGFFWGDAEQQIMQRNYARLRGEPAPAP